MMYISTTFQLCLACRKNYERNTEEYFFATPFKISLMLLPGNDKLQNLQIIAYNSWNAKNTQQIENQ